MFVLCPHCQFLVALDPASGQPPAHCPRCQNSLREPAAAEPAHAPVAEASAAVAAPLEAADAEIPPPDYIAVTAAPNATIAGAATGAERAVGDIAEDAVAAATQPSMPPEIIRDPGLGDAPAPVEAVVSAEQPLSDAAPAAVETADEPAPSLATPHSASELDAETDPSANAGDLQPARRKRSSAPSFVRAIQPARVPDRRRHWLRLAAIAALTLLLGLQLLLADRARLAADARWRGSLTLLCSVLRCSLPPWREPAAFTLLGRDVRPHPTVPGALHVTATFRNDARWAQPWPSLLLTLSDLDGRNVGTRMFTAREYLGAPPTRSGLASGQTATIAMDILEPTPRIVAFTFDFR